MRIEFSRMTGRFICETPLSSADMAPAQYFDELKRALLSFYESDDCFIWPKDDSARNTPEKARVVDPSGIVVVEYSLVDFLDGLTYCRASITPGKDL